MSRHPVRGLAHRPLFEFDEPADAVLLVDDVVSRFEVQEVDGVVASASRFSAAGGGRVADEVELRDYCEAGLAVDETMSGLGLLVEHARGYAGADRPLQAGHGPFASGGDHHLQAFAHETADRGDGFVSVAVAFRRDDGVDAQLVVLVGVDAEVRQAPDRMMPVRQGVQTGLQV